jgi:hypothetical protein
MRADIEPFFDLAGVFCWSCPLSLSRLAHQHIRQPNPIDVWLLPGQGRVELPDSAKDALVLGDTTLTLIMTVSAFHFDAGRTLEPRVLPGTSTCRS